MKLLIIIGFFLLSSPTYSDVIDKTKIAQHNKNDINLSVQNDGKKIILDAHYFVPVQASLVWETLTDFSNFPSFKSSMLSSKITSKKGNTLRVTQVSIIKLSGASFNFESIKEIYLVPFEKINKRMISGNMHKMIETIEIVPEDNNTHIYYHADIVPNMWILNYIGHIFIEDEAREQLQEDRNEIIRRKRITNTLIE
tara:strand:+ start:1218 stop:1808 length:591 start_codon:yes stop_codon:yes gene_type:complete